jgi:hypothetical protein
MKPARLLRAASAAIVFAGVAACSGGSSGPPATVAAPEKIDGVMIERASGHNHRAGHIDYPGPKPPSSGDHAQVWLNCGFYSTPQPMENAVHDIEHGAVWIAYAPSTSPADVAVIRTLTKTPQVVATPVDGMDAPFVLVAWERRLNLDSIEDPRAKQFVAEFSTGKTAPEPGAPCEGGIGTPE